MTGEDKRWSDGGKEGEKDGGLPTRIVSMVVDIGGGIAAAYQGQKTTKEKTREKKKWGGAGGGGRERDEV